MVAKPGVVPEPGVVAVLGSVNMDLVARCRRLPGHGETVLASRLDTVPGGKGANQAVAAARAGARARFAGAVGRDAFGATLRAGLAAEGVDVAGLADVDGPSGIALITTDEAGRNQIVVVAGANAAAWPAPRLLAGADVALAQLEVPVAAVREHFRLARAVGATTVLNAAPAATLDADLAALIDVLVVNEHELDAQPAVVLSAVGATVLTLGEAGIEVRSGPDRFRLDAHPVAVVDTVGAGDAATGALCAALAAGHPLEVAAGWANAAGALATTAAGARTSPSRRALLALLDRTATT